MTRYFAGRVTIATVVLAMTANLTLAADPQPAGPYGAPTHRPSTSRRGLVELIRTPSPEYVQNEAFQEFASAPSTVHAAARQSSATPAAARPRAVAHGVPAAKMRPAAAREPVRSAPAGSMPPIPSRRFEAETHERHAQDTDRHRYRPAPNARAAQTAEPTVQRANYIDETVVNPQRWAQAETDALPTLAAPQNADALSFDELRVNTTVIQTPPNGANEVLVPSSHMPPNVGYYGSNYGYTLASLLNDDQKKLEEQMLEQQFCEQMWACAGGRCLSWHQRLLRNCRRNYETMWRGPCGGGCCSPTPLLSAVCEPILYPRNTIFARCLGLGCPRGYVDPCERGAMYWEGFCDGDACIGCAQGCSSCIPSSRTECATSSCGPMRGFSCGGGGTCACNAGATTDFAPTPATPVPTLAAPVVPPGDGDAPVASPSDAPPVAPPSDATPGAPEPNFAPIVSAAEYTAVTSPSSHSPSDREPSYGAGTNALFSAPSLNATSPLAAGGK